MEITLVVDSIHLNVSNGVNTFINNLVEMLDECVIHILTDSKPTFHKHIELITTDSKITLSSDIVITNCIKSDKLYRNCKEYDSSKSIFFTHIPQILSLNSDIAKYIKKYVHKIGTQSPQLSSWINDNYNIDTIILPQPFIPKINTVQFERNGIIIISSYEDRKNYEDMLWIISKTNYPVTCVCSNGGKRLLNDIQKYGIKKYRILSNIENTQIPNIIAQHKLMLHLSKEEIYPYALLEASEQIPCIINGNSVWGSCCDINNCYAYNTKEEIVNKINDIYNKNIVTTQRDVKQVWINYIKGVENGKNKGLHKCHNI